MPACVNLDCPYLDDFRGICTICSDEDYDCPLLDEDDLISDIPEDD